MILLDVDSIEVQYRNDVSVLRDVSLQVRLGAITTLLGPNAAGKSTLLKSISGLIKTEGGRIVRGSIRFDNVPIHHEDPADLVRRGIFHVMEGRRVFEELTVAENLLAASYSRSRRSGVNGALDRVYAYFPLLRERRNQVAGYLSGGEQQMLVMGRALMAQPKLLLLDEPSLGLAPMLVAEVGSIIRRLNQEEHLTILLVEQKTNLAFSVADYGYVLGNGTILARGTIEMLKQSSELRKYYLGVPDGTGSRSSGQP